MNSVSGGRALANETAFVRVDGERWVLPAFLALLVGVVAVATPPWHAGQSGLWGELNLAAFTWRAAFAVAGSSVVLGVLLSRRSPVWATTLAAWPFLALLVTGTFVWAWWMGLLAIAVCAAVDGWRRAIAPFAATLFVALVYCWSGVPALLPIGPVTATSRGSDDVWITMVVYVLVSSAAVGLAAAAGSARRSQRASAEAAQASQQALEVESVATERARLARDLHDVVAHHVSLVAVRAESAPYTHPELGEAARGVLAEIAGDARRALEELRQVLSVLQRTEEGPELTPHPGIEDIADLVADATAAGQPVALTQEGTHSGVPAAQGYVVYRVVQEALTNARRHAPSAPVDVEITANEGQIKVRVANPFHDDEPAVPGRGLIGMRERVEALGGTLEAGYRSGWFAVIAELPLSSKGTEGR